MLDTYFRELSVEEIDRVAGGGEFRDNNGNGEYDSGDTIVVSHQGSGTAAPETSGGFCAGWTQYVEFGSVLGQLCVLWDGSDFGGRIGWTPLPETGPSADVFLDNEDISGADIGSTEITAGVTVQDVEDGLETFLESWIRFGFPESGHYIYDHTAGDDWHTKRF